MAGLLPLLRVAAVSGQRTFAVPIGVKRDDLLVVSCTGFEPPTPTADDGTPHLPGHLYVAGTAGITNTLDGPKPLTWMGYLWIPYTVTALAGAGSFSFSLPAEYAFGGIPFLQRAVQAVIYRNVKDVKDGSQVSALENYDPTGFGYSNPWAVGAGPVELDSAVMSIATSNGTVAGHAGGDTGGRWVSRGFDQGGRKSVAQFSWVPPDNVPTLRPDGTFTLSGTNPSGFMVGFGLIRKPLLITPVVRQYPRDSRGLAAAPRLFPPSRTGRLVGGHQ